MAKRILLALALAASIGGAVAACNTPASTSSPSTVTPSTAPSTDLTSPSSSPAESIAVPSAS